MSGEIISHGEDVLLISVGRMTDVAINVCNMLNNSNISASVVNLRCVKPTDVKTILKEAENK